MITNIEFSKPQQLIIKEICLTQIQSLTRVYEEDTEDDITLILAQYGVDKVDFKISLSSTIKQFEQVYNNPNILSSLDILDISIFRHILFHVEDNYMEKYPNAVSNLWKKLFILEKYQTEHKVLPEMN